MDKVSFKFDMTYVFSSLADACAFLAQVREIDPGAYDRRMVIFSTDGKFVGVIFWS